MKTNSRQAKMGGRRKARRRKKGTMFSNEKIPFKSMRRLDHFAIH
jgi:hypothetical protein